MPSKVLPFALFLSSFDNSPMYPSSLTGYSDHCNYQIYVTMPLLSSWLYNNTSTYPPSSNMIKIELTIYHLMRPSVYFCISLVNRTIVCPAVPAGIRIISFSLLTFIKKLLYLLLEYSLLSFPTTTIIQIFVSSSWSNIDVGLISLVPASFLQPIFSSVSRVTFLEGR